MYTSSTIVGNDFSMQAYANARGSYIKNIKTFTCRNTYLPFMMAYEDMGQIMANVYRHTQTPSNQ